MSFWSRIFRPSRAVVADPKALDSVSTLDSHGSAGMVRVEAAARRRGGEQPPPDVEIIEPLSHVWRTYPSEGITPERYRVILHDADLGMTMRLMELFDDISNDYHVGSQLRSRKLAVAGAPFDFDAGDQPRTATGKKKKSSSHGQRIADDAAAFWERIPNRTQLVVDILDDFYRGFSCVRPIWDSINGRWWIVDHQAIESRYFRFIDAVEPLICPTPGGGDGVEVPDGYIYTEFRDKAGPVVRAGVGRSVAKLWLHKGYMLVDMASYLERFGSPHVQVNLGKTLKEGDPELERIKDAARAFIADQVGIMPAGATLQVIEAINKAATVRDVYIAGMSFCDLGISKAINGQTLTSDAGPGGIGHGGAAEEHGDTRQDLKDADAERAANVIREQIIAPWTRYHYGPAAPVPYVCINVERPEDRVKATLAEKQRAETVNILRASGLPIAKEDMYAEFDLRQPDDDEDTLPLPSAPSDSTDVGDPAKGVPAPGSKPNNTDGGK